MSSDAFRHLRREAERLPAPMRDFALELLAGMAGVATSGSVAVEELTRRLHQQRQTDQRTIDGLRAQIGALEASIGTLPQQADQQTIRDLRAHAVRSFLAALEAAGTPEHSRAAAAIAAEQYLQAVELTMQRAASAAVQVIAAHYTQQSGDER